ncbi:MAG: class II aldolase/adducin family protein [Blastocatellia bacterium]
MLRPDSLLLQLCEIGASFHERGYAFGSTGNLSVRDGERIRITPTGKSLKALRPDGLACIDLEARTSGDNQPSKEYPFHLAIYRRRPEVNAVVHLHAPQSVALSCLESLDEAQPLPALTPYYFMHVAPLAVLPYFRPGSSQLAEAVEQAAPHHNCMLLRNHGVICAGASLSEAADRAEELEATARLYFTLRGERVRCLTAEQVEELQRVFAKK